MRAGSIDSSPAQAAAHPRKSLCYKTEPVGFTSLRSVVSSVDVKVFEDELAPRLEPTHPHGRRFSRPNGGVPLSPSKAVYGRLTTILPRRFSGEVPLRPRKTRYAGNESGNPIESPHGILFFMTTLL